MSNDTADRWGKWLAIGGTLLAVVAIVLAVRLMGSPMAQRQARIDENRVRDLDMIVDATRGFARAHKALPAQLEELNRQPGAVERIRDPETQVPYEYTRIDANTFRLCAVFTTDTAQQPPEGFPANVPGWKHGKGRTCFERGREIKPSGE